MSKLRVGVLFGGKSIEKEVSFNSGRTICDHLDSFRYDIIPLFQRANGDLYILPWRFLHRGKISDFDHRLESEAQKITWNSLKALVDFIYIALHGKFAEDGTLQGFLEILQIPYSGSKVMASALGMNKIAQKKFLKSAQIATPRDIVIEKNELEFYRQHPQKLYLKLQESSLTLPLVVKPYHEGSSLGVTIVRNQDELLDAIVKAATINPYIHQAVLIEELIKGMEFSCIIITDFKTGNYIPLPPTEIIPEYEIYDYDQKYMPGRATKFTPARCSAEFIDKIQQTCLKVMHTLGFENIGRIDGFLQPDGSIVITDPNSLAGMAPSSFFFKQASEINMSHTKLINHIIETELFRYGMLTKIINREQEKMATIHQISKKKIAVLMGGRSHEREISLESGRNVFYKISLHKYDPIALFVSSKMELYELDQRLLVCNSTKEIEHSLDYSKKIEWDDLAHLVDFAFIALHGGEGENGCVQGMLEMLGIPYNGSSVLASSLCMDKYKTAQFLKSQGFDVPHSYLVTRDQWLHNIEIDAILKQFSFPLIVKPHDDGCSVFVAKAYNEQDVRKALSSIFEDGKTHALIEEFIHGMELTVGVIGNHIPRALPPSKTVSTSDILTIEEKFLPGAGENLTPAPLPQTTIELIQKTIESAYKEINCKGYARIDCFYQDATISPTGNDRVVILEFNTLPGLTPATCIFHQAAEVGMRPMEFIDLIIQLGFEEHMTNSALPKEQSSNESKETLL